MNLLGGCVRRAKRGGETVKVANSAGVLRHLDMSRRIEQSFPTVKISYECFLIKAPPILSIPLSKHRQIPPNTELSPRLSPHS